MILFLILSVFLAVAPNPDLQTQSATTTIQSFTTVQGTDLMSKLEAAQARGRAGRTPYWSAYTFDMRPGVAIDPAMQDLNGRMNVVGDTTVFVGTTANGTTVETRNVAIFLLREPAANQITRIELYNLERKREYSGYPVYWLGRANNEESLNYLRALAAATPLDVLGERAVLGIALHDDARVSGLLKGFVGSSPNPRTRSSAVYWLGQTGGEQMFLAGLVRTESEEKQLRAKAAHAIGDSHERGSVAMLKLLYEELKDPDIRRAVVSATGNAPYGNSEEAQPALNFLLNVAKNETDWETRRTAVRALGRLQLESAGEELIKIYNTDTNFEVKRTALRAMAETKNPKVQARVLELARTETNPDLRKQAIRVLSERGEAAIDDLLRLFDTEQSPQVRRAVLQSLSEIKSPRVEDKLFELARGNEAIDIRRDAIRALGERASQRSFDFLSATAQSNDANAEVQMQAVRSIGERHAEESVPLLIKIARTHPNQQVRKQAIRSLGETGDPRAIEFFREVLSK